MGTYTAGASIRAPLVRTQEASGAWRSSSAEDSPTHRRIRVAWLHPVVAHYRVPVINRLFRSQRVELTVYGGQALDGVSVSDASGELEGPFVPLRNVRLRRRDARVHYVKGWMRVATVRPEVVITTEASHNLTNWALLTARHAWGFKVVIMGHIGSSGQRQVALWSRRRLVQAADGVLAYTREGANQAFAWAVERDRVAVLGNTLDLARIYDSRDRVRPAEVTKLRDTLGVEGLVCLFVGRPNPVKRLDVAIEAMQLLALQGVQAHLIVVGTSRELPNYVEQARGTPNVHFVGEVLDDATLAMYFAAADIVLIPGAVGLSVNHAFAYGVPLVTSVNAPHRPEMGIAVDGANAVMVDAMNARAFADALAELALNRGVVQRLKAGAAATAVPDIDDMVTAIESLVTRVALGS